MPTKPSSSGTELTYDLPDGVWVADARELINKMQQTFSRIPDGKLYCSFVHLGPSVHYLTLPYLGAAVKLSYPDLIDPQYQQSFAMTSDNKPLEDIQPNPSLIPVHANHLRIFIDHVSPVPLRFFTPHIYISPGTSGISRPFRGRVICKSSKRVCYSTAAIVVWSHQIIV
jgi:hypothetical protein